MRSSLSSSRLEMLMLHNWWLSTSIFILSLVMTVIGSVSIIVNGPAMTEYMTLWMNTLAHFNNIDYPTKLKDLRIIAWAHPISTVLNIGAIFFLYFRKVFGFHEQIQIITMMLLRHFKNYLYFELTEQRPYISPLVALFMAYVFSCGRSFVIIIIIFCRGIVHLAEEWNIRLCVILGKCNLQQMVYLLNVNIYYAHVSINFLVSPKANTRLKKMKPQRYSDMLNDHKKIVILISEMSETFATFLVTYALVEVIILSYYPIESIAHAVYITRKIFRIIELLLVLQIDIDVVRHITRSRNS